MKNRHSISTLIFASVISVFCLASNTGLNFHLDSAAAGSVVTQEKRGKIIAYPGRKYIRKELNGDDWVVEIDIPKDGRAPTPYCECDRSQPPFYKTSIIDEGVKNDKRRFSFTAGYRARITSAYNFDEWARVWRVSYFAPIEPRGPQVRPRG